MAENEYDALWDAHEREEFKRRHIDPNECLVDDQLEVTREVLKQFMIIFLEHHLSRRYRSLGLALEGVELFQARAAEVHHWHPSETQGMNVDDLLILLAGEFEHVAIPPDAREVIRMRTPYLPEWFDIEARLA